jgi:hypothetical protein
MLLLDLYSALRPIVNRPQKLALRTILGRYNNHIPLQMRSHESSTGVEARPEVAAATRAGLVSFVLLSCGHFSVDLYSSALGALQPLLMERFHTSLTQAGLLGSVLVFSASVMQPVRYLSDRFHSAFHRAGPSGGRAVHPAMGLASSYHWLLLSCFWAGRVGVPAGVAGAVLGAEGKSARAMAIFVAPGRWARSRPHLLFGNLDQASSTAVGAVPGVLVFLFVFDGGRLPPTPRRVRVETARGGVEATHLAVPAGVHPLHSPDRLPVLTFVPALAAASTWCGRTTFCRPPRGGRHRRILAGTWPTALAAALTSFR